MEIKIGVSNKHVHLSKEDLDILFGHDLVMKKALNQVGEFASEQVVTIKTEKSEIKNVRVLGPLRSYSQVEIAKTDAYKLGVNPPVRESGDVLGGAVVTIVGPNGEVTKDCCIIATRHIHITEEKLNELGLDAKKLYSVKLGGFKGGILHNVSIKVAPTAYFELHIDSDDANAHLVSQDDIGIICEQDQNM